MAALHRPPKVRAFIFRVRENPKCWGIVAAATDAELFWAIDQHSDPYRAELAPLPGAFMFPAETRGAPENDINILDAVGVQGPRWFVPQWGPAPRYSLVPRWPGVARAPAPAPAPPAPPTVAAPDVPKARDSLAAETRPVLTTCEAAEILGRKPQTLRSWASTKTGPLVPVRVGGRLAWKVDDIRQVLGCAA